MVQFEKHDRVLAAIHLDSLTDLTVDSDRCVFTVFSSLVCHLLFGLPSIVYHNTDYIAVTCL